MRILIVDDEPLQRERMARLIRESGLGFDGVDACGGAAEALSIVARDRPEILLTDICMPGTSGTELASRVRQTCPDTIVVLISGHEEFAYAHAGIESRVFDYILKPVDPAVVLRCIARAKEASLSETRRREQHALLTQFMEEHLRGMRRQFVEALLLYPEDGDPERVTRARELFHMDFERFRLVVFRCAGLAGRGEGAYYCAYETTRALQEAEPDWIALSIGGVVYAVAPLPEPPAPDEEALLARRLRRFSAGLYRRLQQPMHVAVSDASADLRALGALKGQTALCLERMSDSPEGDMLLYGDVGGRTSGAARPGAGLERLGMCARAGNQEAVRDILRALPEADGADAARLADAACLADTACLADAARLAVAQLLLALREEGVPEGGAQRMGRRLLAERGDGTLSRGALFAFGDAVCAAVREAQLHASNLLIAQVMDFIDARFAEPIGLTDAANLVQRTPTYLCRLFARCAHTTFTHALTERRVAEAKKLLGDTSLTVAEIAERTGYPNVRYFYRVFQARVGMTANDYRKIVAAFGREE